MVFVILTIGFIGSIFAQSAVGEKEFTQTEIDEMKNKAVLITMNDGTFMIELFPEDAPNTVNNFLKLVESGYYDGMVFHRIISGFMIQTGIKHMFDFCVWACVANLNFNGLFLLVVF